MRINPRYQPRDYSKISLTLISLFIIFILSSSLFSMYPQHLYLSNNTKISSSIQFLSNNTAIVHGNQVSYSKNDIIFIDGREYIKITGNQKTIGSYQFTPAIRTLSSSLTQNPLFELEIGSIPLNSGAKLQLDDVSTLIIPISPTIINIQSSDGSNYNIEFVSDTTYIKSNGSMIKLVKTPTSIKVILVGIKSYSNIWMSTL